MPPQTTAVPPWWCFLSLILVGHSSKAGGAEGGDGPGPSFLSPGAPLITFLSGKLRKCTWLEALEGRSFPGAAGREHRVPPQQQSSSDSGKILLPAPEEKYLLCFGGRRKRQEQSPWYLCWLPAAAARGYCCSSPQKRAQHPLAGPQIPTVLGAVPCLGVNSCPSPAGAACCQQMPRHLLLTAPR